MAENAGETAAVHGEIAAVASLLRNDGENGGHGRGLVICWRTRKRGGRCGRPAVFQHLS